MSDDPASKHGLRWEIRRSLIERLRIRWEGMGEMANQQRAEAAAQISTMMDEIEAWRNYSQKAERDIDRLRTERDEASQRVCSIAYPEQHIQELVKTINTLRAERDEARRELDDARRERHDAQRWESFKEKP